MSADEELAEAFAELARDLYLLDTGGIARRVTAAAPDLVPRCREAAMCLLDRHGGTARAAATGESAGLVDRIQHEAGDGPCPAAIRDGVLRAIPDLLRDDCWPESGRHAAQASGLRCLLTLPLVAGTEVLGALTLFGRSPYAFTPGAVTTARILASHTALALAGTAARRRNAELTEALRSGRLIGMALGIVMAQRRVTPQQAFDVLRQSSRRRNRKVRELAAEIVETGQVPGGSALRAR